MSFSENTVYSSSFIKRFTHSSRIKIAIEILKSFDSKNLSILDYGSGDGILIKKIIDTDNVNYNNIYAFEPLIERFEELDIAFKKNKKITISRNINDFKKDLDIVFCLEVLEHLNDKNLKIAFNRMKKILKKSGYIVVSVPIETGFAGLLKNIIRYIISQPHKGFSFIKYFKNIFGYKINRIEENNDFIESHFGFSHKNLEKEFIRNKLIIKKKIYSPFKVGRTILNSQIFYILIKEIDL